MTQNQVSLRMWGDFACFTRPEMKVERVSYPILTPSAARGILEAILWEPQFYYIIKEIAVVQHRTRDGTVYGKGHWLSVKRNEVQSIINMGSAKGWMRGSQSVSYTIAGGGADDATQRNTLALHQVAYHITAEIQVSRLAKPHRDNVQKYSDLFKRRAKAGKCHHRPCFGCREFAVDFDWREESNPSEIIAWDEDLGWMLYDIFDPEDRQGGFAWYHDQLQLPEDLMAKDRGEAAKRGYIGKIVPPKPLFFHAQVSNGRMNCDPQQVKIIRS